MSGFIDKQHHIAYFKDIAALLHALETVRPQSNHFHIHRHEDVPESHLAETKIFRSDTFSASLLTAGEAEYKIGMQDYRMGPGSFYFMSPPQLRYYRKIEPWRGYVFLFSEEFMLQFSKASVYQEYPFFQLDEHVQLQLSCEQVAELSALLEKLHEVYNGTDGDKMKVVYHYLSLVLLLARKWHGEQIGGLPKTDTLVSLARFRRAAGAAVL